MKSLLLAAALAVGMMGVTATAADAHPWHHHGWHHHRHCVGWGWHHHHERFCRHWGW
jgi:Spy/CpxP family protein refolding chaperone